MSKEQELLKASAGLASFGCGIILLVIGLFGLFLAGIIIVALIGG